jgi:hypothetical protein
MLAGFARRISRRMPRNVSQRYSTTLERCRWREFLRRPSLRAVLRYSGNASAVEPDDLAAFIVHEFATGLTTERRREANKKALAEFVGDVNGAVAPSDDWWLLGPFYVPSERWSNIPLFIGHLTTPGTGS